MAIGVQQNEIYAKSFSTLAWHNYACFSVNIRCLAVFDIAFGT
jgi:hypothetical protein